MTENSECLFMNLLGTIIQIPYYVGFKPQYFKMLSGNVEW